MNTCVRGSLVSLILLGMVSEGGAAIILPNLPYGSQYQLAFLTDGERRASSTNIASYNNFVRAQAAQNPDLPAVTWNAIGSTATVDARDNAPSPGVPVYNLHGELVTAHAGGLYAATNLTNRINYDQFGDLVPPTTVPNRFVWTGSIFGGVARTGAPLGSGTIQLRAVYGDTFATDLGWLSFGTARITGNLRMYALSSVITVVPEPCTIGLVLSGVVLLFLRRVR